MRLRLSVEVHIENKTESDNLEPEDNKVYFYTLSCPDKGHIHYVGKTINPEARLRQHYYSHATYNSNNILHKWIKFLRNSGKIPLMTVVGFSYDLWNSEYIEKELIERNFEDGHLLFNKKLVSRKYREFKKSASLLEYKPADVAVSLMLLKIHNDKGKLAKILSIFFSYGVRREWINSSSNNNTGWIVRVPRSHRNNCLAHLSWSKIYAAQFISAVDDGGVIVSLDKKQLDVKQE